MSTRSLPILMPRVEGQRWSCHSCGRCCYDLVGHLSSEERMRLNRQDWRGELGVEPYVRMGRAFVLNKHDDGACVFLDRQTKLCRIHVKFGEQAKPLACRIYPFTVYPVSAGWQAALRFDCPSVADAKGAPLQQHRAPVAELLAGLPHPGAVALEEPILCRDIRLAPQQTRQMIERFLSLFGDHGRPLRDQILAAVSAVLTLSESRLERVGLERFDELADMVFAAADGGRDGSPPRAPSAGQVAMLRELVFAHAEHVNIRDMTASLPRRWARRWRQLRLAGRMRRGRGRMPAIPGLPGTPSFQHVEDVQPAGDPSHTERIDSLLRRYLTARLESRGVFGPGYYDWPLVSGLLAFMASLAAMGWLARAQAACRGRSVLAYEDVFEALRIIDRSAGRSPALRTRAERLRMHFLARERGLAGLLDRYALT
ncbi:MAG: YkgJ family cysteine cluster protein [Phycisphaerales bacterium]|nr:YkgJ family cysteine cluster protein [Phycisphaerales bacterium]